MATTTTPIPPQERTMEIRANYKNVKINEFFCDGQWVVRTAVAGKKGRVETKRFDDEFLADLHYVDRRNTLVDLASRDGEKIAEHVFRDGMIIDDN